MKTTLVSLWNEFISFFKPTPKQEVKALTVNIVSLYDAIKTNKIAYIKNNGTLSDRLNKYGEFNYPNAGHAITVLSRYASKLKNRDEGHASIPSTGLLEFPEQMILDDYLLFTNRTLMDISEYLDTVETLLEPIVPIYNNLRRPLQQHYDRIMRSTLQDLCTVITLLEKTR